MEELNISPKTKACGVKFIEDRETLDNRTITYLKEEYPHRFKEHWWQFWRCRIYV